MTNYNSKCPACGGAAYLGFVAVECSNPNCKNFVKVDVAPPSLMNQYAKNPVNTAYYGTVSIGPSGAVVPPPPPPPPAFQIFGAAPYIPLQTSSIHSHWNYNVKQIGSRSYDAKIKLIPNSLKEVSFNGSLTNGQQAVDEYKRMELLASLFELVFRHSQEAVIAGGAARDIFLGRIPDIVDFDFFVRGFDRPAFEVDFGDTLTQLSAQPGFTANSSYAAPPTPIGTPPSKFEVYQGNVGNNIFQIIECDDIAGHIKAFDFGLNMIAISCMSQPNRSLTFDVFFWESVEFMIDNSNKTLTFYPAKCLRPKSLTKRWLKMSAKFPNHRLAMG